MLDASVEGEAITVQRTDWKVVRVAEPNWANKTIWTGDNLPIMRGMNSASVDLIYLDPPFNSKANYAAPIGSEAAGAEFKDTWTLQDVDIAWLDLIEAKHPRLNKVIHAAMSKSDKSYLIYMAVRLLEMHRILKSTGSIYLHCDPTMSHYLKLLMDAVFGKKSFQSEITWQRTSSHNDRVFGNVRDTILFYGTVAVDLPDNRLPLDPEYVRKHYRHEDSRGKWRSHDLTGARTSSGESGQPWRGFDPASYGGRHWSIPKIGEYAKYIDEVLAPGYLKIEGIHARLDFLDEHELIHWQKKQGSFPCIKRYLLPDQGRKPTNLFTDIPPLSKSAQENTGYPTQKPLALLERLIKASSENDDVVFDPFCGCATTLVAADRHKRNWIGIDISPVAMRLVEKRIKDDQGMFQDIQSRVDIPERTDLGDIPNYNCVENKKFLFGEQEGICNGCQEYFQYRHLEVDHIIARSQGGGDHLGNLQLLCTSCNRIKGHRGQEYLLAKLAT